MAALLEFPSRTLVPTGGDDRQGFVVDELRGEVMETKICPICGKTLYREPKHRKGYQGQDWIEIGWEDHGTEDCIKYLRSLIDDIGSRRIV